MSGIVPQHQQQHHRQGHDNIQLEEAELGVRSGVI